MHKIRKDDLVKVIAGKDKDKTGKVLSVKDGKVLVEGCNMITKHAKPNAANPNGGIINQSLQYSLVPALTQLASILRFGISLLETVISPTHS